MSDEKLESALRIDRALGIAAVVLGTATVAGGVWQALPSTPGGVVSWGPIVLLIATIALAAGWYVRHQQVIAALHAKIMAASRGDPSGTSVERAIKRRVRRLETPRARKRVASDLRNIARQASEAPTRRPVGGALALFNPSERRILAENTELLTTVADAISASAVDPQALVILRRVAAGYPAAHADDADAGPRLLRNLLHAEQLIGLPEAIELTTS